MSLSQLSSEKEETAKDVMLEELVDTNPTKTVTINKMQINGRDNTIQIGVNTVSYEDSEDTSERRRLFCANSGHQNSPLSAACVSVGCKNKGLICLFCMQKQHQKHDLILTDNLFSELVEWNKQFDIENQSAAFLEEVIKAKEIQMEKYQKQKAQFGTLLGQIGKRIESYYNFFLNSIKIIKEACGNPNNLYGFQRGKSKEELMDIYYDLASCVRDFKDSPAKAKISTIQQISEYWANKHILAKKTTEFWSDVFQSANKILELTAVQINNRSKLIIVEPSETLKSDQISVFNYNLKLGNQQNTEFNCCLLNPTLKKDKRQRWVLKIQSLSNSLYIGITSATSTAQKGYKSVESLSTTYAIRQDGVIYTPNKAAINSTFRFSSNNIIMVTYDPVQMKVIFDNITTKDTHSLVLQEPIFKDLHPFVQINRGTTEVACNPKLPS